MFKDTNREVLFGFSSCISCPYMVFVLKFVVFISGGCRCGVCGSCDAGVSSCVRSELDCTMRVCVLGGTT